MGTVTTFLDNNDKQELEQKIEVAKNSGGVTSINGKTGIVTIDANEVGADPTGTAVSSVSQHNISDSSHNDIRLLIEGLTTLVNSLLDCDDETLNQTSEIVAYIKANKGLIDGITTNKVNVADIVDNLTTSVSNKPLSAKQGVALKSLIDTLTTNKLDASSLTSAVEQALATAKASGEFDGEDGVSITKVTMFDDEDTSDGATNEYEIWGGPNLLGTFRVKNGSKGSQGVGVSRAEILNNELIITLTDGQELNLGNVKGDKGDQGIQGQTGDAGKNGKDGVSVTHSWNGTMLTITSASGTSSVDLKGDQGIQGKQGIQGPEGPKGEEGPQGPQGLLGPQGVAGYTPVKGTDYWTPEDKAEIVEDVKNLLEEPVNYTNILNTAVDRDGVTIYNNGKGYKENARWSSSSNSEVDSPNYDITGWIKIKNGDVIRLKNFKMPNADTNSCVFVTWGNDLTAGPNSAGNGSLLTKYWDAQWDENGNLQQFKVIGTNYHYIRLQCDNIDDTSIVTINEEIPEDTIDVQLDNINEILHSQNERLTILETLNTDDLSIPSYYKSHADEKIDKIRELMEKAGRNKSSFLFYSDAHWDNASKVCPSLLNYITKYTAINKTIFGGDIVNVEPTTETLSDRSIMKYLWDWRNQIRNLRHYSVIGNHDDGNGNTATGGPTNSIFDLDYVYSFLFAPEENNAGIVRDADTYYYFDDSREKTRYLCLDTSYDLTLSTSQSDFIKESLKSTPENWHIIVVAHIWYGPDYDAYYNQGVRPIPIAGLSSTAASITTILDNYNARKDVFADCKAKVEFCIGGHVHIDYVNTTTGGIPIILCETASSNLRSGGTCSMSDITQTAVSSIIADYEDNVVNIVRVGRGSSFKVDLTTGEQTDQEENTPDTPTQEPEITTYTNVLDTAGYETGYRLNSSATTTARADRCVTGFIPAKFGDTVYFKNIEMLKDDYGCMVAFYNSNKEKINAYLCSDAKSACTWLDDNTLKSFKMQHSEQIAYVRFCFVSITDDSIITINEPID